MNRSILESDSRRVSHRQIQRGDRIQRWVPVMVPTGDWPPFAPDSSGEMELVSEKTAIRNDLDLAGRWSDDQGELVHGAHDWHGEGNPPPADIEVLLRV